MGLKVIGDNGKPVDWFFMYKLPAGASDPQGESKSISTGTEYLYFDNRTKSDLALSDHAVTDPASALQATLAQIYPDSSRSGHVLYNDEVPDGPMDGRYGHTKGVLGFDTKSDTAFWLIHSVPKYPTTKDPMFPDSGVGNGQSALCITLENVAAAEKIAEIMRVQQQPQIYHSKLPPSLAKTSALNQLVGGVDLNAKDQPASLKFSSRGGQKFRLFAKNRGWGRDLWREFIAGELDADLEVETWRRLELDRDDKGRKESDTGREDVEDIRFINLEHIGIPFEWHYTKDHSKLGTSKEYDWVIVADINRDESQSSRGGGAVAFQNQSLWDNLSRVEVIYDPGIDLHYQKLLAKGKKTSRPIKGRGKSKGAKLSVDIDAKRVAKLENIAKEHKIKNLSKAIKYLIDKDPG